VEEWFWEWKFCGRDDENVERGGENLNGNKWVCKKKVEGSIRGKHQKYTNNKTQNNRKNVG
jgi:hypothetical protein